MSAGRQTTGEVYTNSSGGSRKRRAPKMTSGATTSGVKTSAEFRARERAKREEEDAYWASLAGPVETRKVGEERA